jgi:hypothetical protein
MTILETAITALIDAAREVEAAIDAWGKTDMDDPAETEKDAMLKTGHALYLALLEYDRAIAHNRQLKEAHNVV